VAGAPAPPGVAPPAAPAGEPLDEQFARALATVDGVVHRVSDLEAARARARELVAGATVARWDDAALDGIADAASPAADADVSLIVADAAVADTGAIAFVHGPGRPRGAGVLPPRQIALLAAGDIARSTPEALAHWTTSPPGNVVLTAGPSRTSDIEQRVIRGVHGPRSLDVIVYG
jgi:L-lactate dehydrogenase complex protein LldG